MSFELIFYPINTIFTVAPYLYWALLLGGMFVLLRYTYRTFVGVTDVASLKSIGLPRLYMNLILALAMLWVCNASSVAPKATIHTRPSANEQYLKNLDASHNNRARGERAERSESPTMDELTGRTSGAEAEQDERINNTGRDSQPN